MSAIARHGLWLPAWFARWRNEEGKRIRFSDGANEGLRMNSDECCCGAVANGCCGDGTCLFSLPTTATITGAGTRFGTYDVTITCTQDAPGSCAWYGGPVASATDDLIYGRVSFIPQPPDDCFFGGSLSRDPEFITGSCGAGIVFPKTECSASASFSDTAGCGGTASLWNGIGTVSGSL